MLSSSEIEGKFSVDSWILKDSWDWNRFTDIIFHLTNVNWLEPLITLQSSTFMVDIHNPSIILEKFEKEDHFRIMLRILVEL